MIVSEAAPKLDTKVLGVSQLDFGELCTISPINFVKEHSMFTNPECYWHEFHYFVSQLYYGEKIGVEIARKLYAGADDLEKKKNLRLMLDDEIRHEQLFEDYIIETFGYIFPRSMGMERIVRLCQGSDDPRLLAIVTHGVLEPCGMVTLKALRKFVIDDRFRSFTTEVLRDEGHHISLITANNGEFDKEYMDGLKEAATTAFKSTASVGRAKELIQFLKQQGIDMGEGRPQDTEVYRQKFDLSIRVVKNQLDEVGVAVF